MKIFVNDMRLFGYHGVYPMEKKIGNEFVLHAVLDVDLPDSTVQLDETVDYSKVFAIIKAEFAQTEDLLENLANRIIDVLLRQFSQIREIELKIIKTNPPIEGFTGSVGVGAFKKQR